MTIELVLFTAILSLAVALTSACAFGYVLHTHKQYLLGLSEHLYYLEIRTRHTRSRVPEEEKIRSDYKKEGNIVYLPQHMKDFGDN